jgi:hypothetical protein
MYSPAAYTSLRIAFSLAFFRDQSDQSSCAKQAQKRILTNNDERRNNDYRQKPPLRHRARTSRRRRSRRRRQSRRARRPAKRSPTQRETIDLRNLSMAGQRKIDRMRNLHRQTMVSERRDEADDGARNSNRDWNKVRAGKRRCRRACKGRDLSPYSVRR